VAGFSSTVDQFTTQKYAHKRVFRSHQTYAWDFPRARVVATADPAPLIASLDQIERHATGPGRGICILSVFNNLVPFLGGRYSILPDFELQWALTTEAELQRTIERVARARPAVLFVGREVEASDLKSEKAAPGASELQAEQAAARGRVQAMARVFAAVAADYQRVETGPLLSVYRRRTP
jgi:hypothetical protein